MVLWTKSMVLSDKEKAGLNQLGECEGDERPREPLIKASKCARSHQNWISCDKARISLERTCLLSKRWAAQRRHELHTGVCAERGNPRTDVKGENQAAKP